MQESYHPKKYWSNVAERIDQRSDSSIAGDDSPFYRYKRMEFVKLLDQIRFENQQVLEIGPGPGANLMHIYKKNPSSLTGVDISKKMISIAKKRLEGMDISLVETDGESLPFNSESFDVVFSATVLQHNTEEVMMQKMLSEMCRVSRSKVCLFERIEKKLKGDHLCAGRTVETYASICEESGFNLVEKKFIQIEVSHWVSGAIRKGLNSKARREGEHLNALSIALQKISLPVTSLLDHLVKTERDLGMLVFERTNKGK